MLYKHLETYWDKLNTCARLIPNQKWRGCFLRFLSPRTVFFPPIQFSPLPVDDDQLLSVLRPLGNFTYVPNFGNLDDAVITLGTYQFFRKYHLSYQITKAQRGDNIVCAGGDIWVKDHNKNPLITQFNQAILEQMKIAKRVVILPSSFHSCLELIDILDQKFTVFCRERKSYDYLKSQKTKALILLDQDMAFRMTSCGGKCKIDPDLYSWMQKTKMMVSRFKKSAYFLRQDLQRKNINTPAKNECDISATINSFWTEKNGVNVAVWHLANICKGVQNIITDRLHIAITAALLGIPVELSDNSYGKNKAVYQHSLKHYKNVSFTRYDDKVSILIPVYNAGRYLKRCLDSLLKQTYSNLEIICVNDGSTDSSGNILKKYAQMDPRIKVITTKNQGISAARNTALDHTTGTYMCWVDADDYVAPDYVEQLYLAITKNDADFAIGDMMAFGKNPDIVRQTNLTFQKQFSEQNYPINPFLLPPMVWGKMFRMSLIEKHHIRFPIGLINEDNYWIFMIAAYTKKYAVVKKILYYYRKDNPNSIMAKTQFEGDKKYDIVKICCAIFDSLKKTNNLFLLDILDDFFVRKVLAIKTIHKVDFMDSKSQKQLEPYFSRSPEARKQLLLELKKATD